MRSVGQRLTVLLWVWNGFRPIYDHTHVRALTRQLREYLKIPHRVVLLTDDVHSMKAANTEVDAVEELPWQPAYVGPGHGSPANCFRRLRIFDSDYSARFGTEWVASLDLDSLLLGPIDELVEYALAAPSGLTIMRARFHAQPGARPYNGGFYAVRVGAQAQVWERFRWDSSPQVCRESRWTGSDQVWIALNAPDARTVGPEHGAYFAEQYLQAPPDKVPAKVVTFAGGSKPWSKTSKRETPEYWRAYQRFA